MATRAKKPVATEVYVAAESFAITLGVGQVVSVPAGARYRGDHPIVRQAPDFFVPEAATTDEVAARRTELMRSAEAALDVLPQPAASTEIAKPIRAKDALLCIADGPARNRRFPRSHKDAKKHPEAYVPVVPEGLARRDAVVPTQTLSMTDENGERRIVYAGTWVHRDDPIVALNPHICTIPDEEE